MSTNANVTELLAAHAAGEKEALAELFQLVYGELRLMARSQRRRLGGSATINTTGLVHEAYLKLVGGAAGAGQDRGHFFAVAARAMRHILVDYARAQRRDKRGGGAPREELDEEMAAFEQETATIIAVHEALDGLAEVDERLVQVVECRYFAGFTEPETAEALGVSLSTVQRSWRAIRTYLGSELGALEQS